MTEKLEKELINFSTDYIYNEAVSNFLLLLLYSIEELEKSDAYTLENIPPKIINIKKEVLNTVSSLKIILEDNNIKSEALETALGMKKQVLSIYESVFLYFIQWQRISTLVSDESAIRKYGEENVSGKKIEFSVFYEDCFEFLQNAENFNQQKQYMNKLFMCIPLKMTRNKYFDFLEESLLFAFNSEDDETLATFINMFKNTYAPDISPAYGKYAPHIAEAMSEKLKIIPSSMSDIELDEAFGDLEEIFETILEIKDYCQALYDSINSLITLFYLNFSFEDLTESNFEYTDIYYKVSEMINNPEDSSFFETISSLLENHIETSLNKTTDINKKQLKLLAKLSENHIFSEDSQKTLTIERFIRENFNSMLGEDIFSLDLDTPSNSFDENSKKNIVKETSEFLSQYFLSLPFHLRKVSMRDVFTLVPVSMDLYDFIDYIKSAIDNSKSFEHSLLIIDKIGAVFEDSGFDYKNEDFEEDEFHDHNCGHHHCGCEHDHHH